MRISRTPQRRDDSLTFDVNGDVLTINGEPFDFSEIPEGGYVETVPCDWIVGAVRRIDGDIALVLIEPHGPLGQQEGSSHVES